MATGDGQPGAGEGPGAAMRPGAEPALGIERTAAVRDHLANERTLLAWQRTALAMVGLGFVVDRFAFEDTPERSLAGTVLGLGLIVAGALAALAGVWRFVRVEREIDTDSYQPSIGVHLVLAGAIVVAAVAMVLYLLLVGPA